MIDAYIIHLLIIMCIYAVLALALHISVGFGGMLNLGHISFFCIGAYASALLTLNGIPFMISLAAAGLMALLLGFLLSFGIRKLKGDYLALVTLGFSFIIYSFALNWTSLTRGPLGIPGIPKPVIFGISLSSNTSFLAFALIIALLSYLFIKRMVHSGFGKALQAVRDDELGAKTLGKDTFRIKSYALAASAFFAGIAGSLYAHYITFIDPSSFTLMQLMPVMTIVIIGGLTSLEGTLLATAVLTLIPEMLRFVGFSSSIIGPARQMLFALILIIILAYHPKGLFGEVELR